MSFSSEIRGMPQLLEKLRQLESLAPIKAGMKAAAVHVKGKVAKYPKVSRRPQAFVSAKQRRGFFARLRAGQIEVPYRRGTSPMTERLGQSWTIEERDDGLTQVIGTNVSYARLVQDEKKQTAYHAGTGWRTAQAVLEQEGREVVRRVELAVRRLIGG
jgi:hypothetical protein